MIVLIDNYDSFSYNLYQLIGSIDPDIKVVRNDEMTIEEIEKFIDTIFHFLMAGTYLFQRLELRTFILADEIQMKCLVIVRDIRLYQM